MAFIMLNKNETLTLKATELKQINGCITVWYNESLTAAFRLSEIIGCWFDSACETHKLNLENGLL